MPPRTSLRATAVLSSASYTIFCPRSTERARCLIRSAYLGGFMGGTVLDILLSQALISPAEQRNPPDSAHHLNLSNPFATAPQHFKRRESTGWHRQIPLYPVH
ncbi:hypothetical protein EJ06DRAFT_529797 [Trichodelitschia bisporula]|uniref:Uncharacterized protein n=1 Tax=Trichodelitschia bisporula TaxID=703511 RepID=A0A6G1HXY6_9PEZI|nr:hypothetical protein EJ06DRAFT_529797 [Trichodelitschia bisporula]